MQTVVSVMKEGAAVLVLGLSALAWTSSAHAKDEALDEATVQAMEAKCEAAREAKINPLREAEIQKCIAEKGRDPEYCRRYWRDYGAATRFPNGKFRPRMFDDLPECVAAFEARRKLNLQGK